MPTLHRIFGCLRLLFSWLFNNLRGIQKKRGFRLLSFHDFEVFALPVSLEQQREAHAEYKHSPCHIVKVRGAYTHIRKRRTK